jgi:hypothetical protein
MVLRMSVPWIAVRFCERIGQRAATEISQP